MGVREFTGELDPAPVVKEFTGTLDGESPGLVDRVKDAWNAGRNIQPLPGDSSNVFVAGMPDEAPPVFVDPAATATAERMLGFEPTRPVQEVGFAQAGRRSMANERRAQRAAERAALPSIEPTPYSGLSARDPALSLKAGSADIGQAVGKGLRYAGAEQAGQLLQDAGSRVSKEAQRAMSPSGQIAMEGQIFDDDLNAGETPLASASLQALRSLPAMVAMLPAGAGISKGITAAGGKTLELLATRPGWVGFLSRTMPSAVGAGVAEGSVAALQNAAQTEEQILAMPLADVRKSPYYAKLLDETDPAQPLAQRERQVRKAIAGIASDEVARRTFVATGGLGALLGGGAQGMVLRRMAGQGAGESVGRALIKGAGEEALQEAPQSGAEQYIQNLATQNYIDPSIDASRGVVGAAASGAAVGGLTGGVLGGGARVLPGPTKEQTPTEIREEQIAQANAAAGAELRAALSGQPRPAPAPSIPAKAPNIAPAAPNIATPEPAVVPGSMLASQGLADPNAPAEPMPTVATLPDGSSVAGQVIGETPEGDTEFLGDDGVSYRFAPGEAEFGAEAAPEAVEPAPPVAELPAEPAPRVSILPEGVPLDGEIAESSIAELQAQLANTDPFSQESSDLTERLQLAIQSDAEQAIAAGDLPIYRVTDHVSVAIHPSAQNPGQIQVTRYSKDGVIGDSQYNTLADAIRQEGLSDKPRLAEADARAVIENAIRAEQAYQQRRAEIDRPAPPVDKPATLPAEKQAAAAPAKAPDLVDVKTADGRTVRVLRADLNGPRALIRVHDAAGNVMQNEDGNVLLVKRDQLTQPAAPVSQPKPEVPPKAATIKPPATPKPKRPAAPKSLLTFLKSKGGISTSEAEDLGGEPAKVLNKKFPTLFRKAGLSADAAREVLQQHGWLDGIAEADQLEETRFLIMKALRGDKTVVKDAVALLEAEADARAAEYYAENGGHPSHHADDMNAAVESLADLQLDAQIDAAWNSTKGSMSDEDIAAWLGEDQTEARREGAEGPAAGTAASGVVAGGGEATEGQGFELAAQTDTDLAAKEARENDAKAADRERIKQESEVGAGLFELSAPQKPTALVEAENKAKIGDLFAGIEQARAATDTNPTDGQKEAGNYAKGKLQWNGLTISLENPKGSERTGKDSDGETWSVTMPADYGYFNGFMGADKDHVDVFMGPSLTAPSVWIINQKKVGGGFDEHKVMAGFDSADKAKAAYLASFSEGFGEKVFDSIVGPVPAESLADVLPKLKQRKAFDGLQKSEGNATAASINDRLKGVAARLGVKVENAGAGFHADSGVIVIPDEDVDVQSAISREHVFAHELGHASMQKRGVSVKGFPKSEMLKLAPNYDELVEASKAFRPGVHNHENEKYRRHAMKPGEIVADAFASVMIGNRPVSMIEPLMKSLGMTARDLGLADQSGGATEKAAPTESTKPASKIADFGEKIGGAKKDLWTGYKDKLTEAEGLDIQAEPLAKSWPAPDYQALLDSGVDPFVVAFVRASRDAIPRKPVKSWKLKSWAGGVELLRDTSKKLIAGELSAEKAKELVRQAGNVSRGMQGIAGRIELYELVGHRQSLDGISLTNHFYSLYKGEKNVDLWAVEKDAKATMFSNWPSEIVTGKTKEEALEKFKALYEKTDLNPAKSKEASFDLYSQAGKFYVGKKMGRNITQLAGPFDTVKEARAYRTDNEAELLKRLEKAKEIPPTRRDTNQPRVGEDMRSGQDVTPEMFADAFGFKGVEFGNWVEQKKRQRDLNDAFDALMDMAAILGVPSKSLSLNGELGLAFGARGQGGIDPALAHYESGKVVINLTKKNGAGSLGHEWWHALDNYFSRMRSKVGDFTTEALDVSLAGRGSEFIANTAVRKEMVQAFGEVVKAIRQTALKARSSKLDAKRSKEYWTTTREMTARAFESYLISKLQDQNASNDYLANIVDEKTWSAAEALGFELESSYPYPTAGEVPVIRAAFDNFFKVVETKETAGGNIAFNSIEDLTKAAKSSDAFQNPRATSADLAEAIKSVNPAIRVQKLPDNHPDARPKAKNWVIFTPDGGKAYLHDFGKEIQFNASQMKSGQSRGSALYQAIFDWADNAGKIFEGDSQGLSVHGAIRRMENMISSAFKHNGETLHMKPHAYQTDPATHWNEETRKNLAKIGFKGFQWATGNNDANIAAMLKASYDVVKTLAPEIENVQLDEYGDFVTPDGEFFTDRDFIKLADEAATKFRSITGIDEGPVLGIATLKRAALYRTVSRGTSSEVGRGILAGAGAELPAALRRIFYSVEKPQTDSAAFKRWFGDSKVVDAEGKPLVVYHGSTAAGLETIEPGYREPGAWFTRNYQYANDYAKGPYGEIYEVYLNAKNPMIVRFGDGGTPTVDGNALVEENDDGDESPIDNNVDIVKYAKRKGYDSVHFPDGNFSEESEAWVVFSPTQIKSATGNRGTFDPNDPNILASVETDQQAAKSAAVDRAIARMVGRDVPELKRESARLRLAKLRKDLDAGKLNDAGFVREVEALHNRMELAAQTKRYTDRPERVRGADFIRQKLLEAKRRGDISAKAADLAEWFVLKNPALLDELGISVKMPKADSASSGTYNPLTKIVTLFAGKASDTTAVHEVLHHLERMMPADMQNAVRQEWARAVAGELKTATGDRAAYFEAVLTGDMAKATKLITDGKVAIDDYQYLNPSEFWAVRMTNRVSARYDTQGKVWATTLRWLKEALEHIKGVLGLRSDAPLLKALNAIIAGDGTMQSKSMLADAKEYNSIADHLLGAKFAFEKTGVAPAWEKATSYVLDRIGERIPEVVKAGLVSDYGLDGGYIERKADMKAAEAALARKSFGLVETLANLTRAEARVAYHWMQEKPESLMERRLMAQLPESSRDTLKAMKQMITDLGAEAVSLGQLSAESYERNKNAYLHLTYQKHVLDQEGAVAKFLRTRSAKIKGNQYKGRGIFEEVPMRQVQNIAPDWWKRKEVAGKADAALKGETFIRFEQRDAAPTVTDPLPGMTSKALGKVKAIAYWPTSEPVPARFGEWVSSGVWEARNIAGDKVTMHRDLTAEERHHLGELDEVRYAVAQTLQLMIHDVEVGKFFAGVAKEYGKPNADGMNVVPAKESMDVAYTPDTWVEVPSSKLAGTQVKKYGALAGMFVPGPVWNDLRQTASHQAGGFMKIYEPVLRFWKKSRTAWSPGVHTNNVIANFVMADWHDIRAKHLWSALDTWAHNKTTGKAVWERFQDSGALGGMFASNELLRDEITLRLEEMKADLTGESEAEMAAMAKVLHLVALATVQPVKKAGNALSAAYQAEDEFFRLAAFLKAIEEGKTDREAGKEARDAFLNYDINAPWVQAARRSILPFVSFFYRAMPMLVETVQKRPWKIVKLMAFWSLISALGYAATGGDEDEERALLPDEKSGKVWGMVPKMIRLPWNSDDGAPIFLDIRRWLPVGDVFDIDQGHGFPPWLVPGGPLVTLAEIMPFVNKSTFTQKEIVQESDSFTEAQTKRLDHVFKSLLPNVPVPNPLGGDMGTMQTHAWGGIQKARGRKENTVGEVRSVPQAVGNALGIKVGSYPRENLQAAIVFDARGKEREIRKEMDKIQRDLSRLKAPTLQQRTAAKKEIQEQADKLKEIQRKKSEKLNPPKRSGLGAFFSDR